VLLEKRSLKTCLVFPWANKTINKTEKVIINLMDMISNGDCKEESLIKTPSRPQPTIEAKEIIKNELQLRLMIIIFPD